MVRAEIYLMGYIVYSYVALQRWKLLDIIFEKLEF